MNKSCFCGNSFITYPSKLLLGRGKYCSRICSDKAVGEQLKELGVETRFKKGNIAYNRREFIITKARKNSTGYKQIYSPFHPFCSKKGYVREHRLVMEKHIGRYLYDGEIVHHIDGDGMNNDLNNLQLMTKQEHDSIAESKLRHINFTP